MMWREAFGLIAFVAISACQEDATYVGERRPTANSPSSSLSSLQLCNVGQLRDLGSINGNAVRVLRGEFLSKGKCPPEVVAALDGDPADLAESGLSEFPPVELKRIIKEKEEQRHALLFISNDQVGSSFIYHIDSLAKIELVDIDHSGCGSGKFSGILIIYPESQEILFYSDRWMLLRCGD